MGRFTDEQHERLKHFYARLPDIACKGLCQHSCGPIPVAAIEREAIAQNCNGTHVEADEENTCKLLVNGRCSIHKHRPLICRLWGVVEDPRMTCLYDCAVLGEKLSDEEVREFFRLVHLLGGV